MTESNREHTVYTGAWQQTRVGISPPLRVHGPNWNIISGGASMLQLTKDDLLDGPVVAVNRAIQVSNVRNIKVDIWAAWDDPDREPVSPEGNTPWSLYQPYVPDYRLMMWVALEHLGAWIQRMYMRSAFAVMPGAIFQTGFLPEGKHACKTVPTVFLVVEEAIKWGAKRIRLLCADMDGNENPTRLGTNPQPVPWEGRWAYEKDVLAAFQKALPKKGVQFETWKPSHPLTEGEREWLESLKERA